MHGGPEPAVDRGEQRRLDAGPLLEQLRAPRPRRVVEPGPHVGEERRQEPLGHEMDELLAGIGDRDGRGARERASPDERGMALLEQPGVVHELVEQRHRPPGPERAGGEVRDRGLADEVGREPGDTLGERAIGRHVRRTMEQEGRLHGRGRHHDPQRAGARGAARVLVGRRLALGRRGVLGVDQLPEVGQRADRVQRAVLALRRREDVVERARQQDQRHDHERRPAELRRPLVGDQAHDVEEQAAAGAARERAADQEHDVPRGRGRARELLELADGADDALDRPPEVAQQRLGAVALHEREHRGAPDGRVLPGAGRQRRERGLVAPLAELGRQPVVRGVLGGLRAAQHVGDVGRRVAGAAERLDERRRPQRDLGRAGEEVRLERDQVLLAEVDVQGLDEARQLVRLEAGERAAAAHQLAPVGAADLLAEQPFEGLADLETGPADADVHEARGEAHRGSVPPFNPSRRWRRWSRRVDRGAPTSPSRRRRRGSPARGVDRGSAG